MPELSSYKKDYDLLVQAARAAGDIAKTAFLQSDMKVWDKAKNHPVTEADLAVNNCLHDLLMTARPDYGWLSEETKDDRSRHERTRSFVIDPIDGTRAFIDRSPNFTVSLAVIENDIPIVGVIYNPLKDELFGAYKGGGAVLNDKPISPSPCREIAACKMIGYPRKFRRLGWPPMDVSVVNSMAYRVALVAAGLRDGTVSFTPKSDWDVAAGAIIAVEAGARITTLDGAELCFNQALPSQMGIVCSGPELHQKLTARLRPLVDVVKKSDNPSRDFSHMGTFMSDRDENNETEQLLHIVIGGELVDPLKTEFKDLDAVEYVGAYSCYSDARDAWKAAAQRTVDNAHMRYFVLHAHKLIDPDKDGFIG